MKRFGALLLTSLVFAGMAYPQGRPVDWPFYGGDARRTGWARSDSRITKENVKDFQLVLKRKLENPDGIDSLTPPVVIGLLISYRGFKELGFVAGSSGKLWSIDVDINRVFWEKQFEPLSGGSKTGSCSGITAMPALTPPMAFRRRGSGGGESSTVKRSARVAGVGFGTPRPVYLLAKDGKLRQLNSSNGSDQFPPLNFLPPNSKASTLTMHDHVIYTTTSGGCGGAANGVWAIDLAPEEAPVKNFALNGGRAGGVGGFALGNDGTVYVQTGQGPMAPASNKWSNTLLALTPKELKLKEYFTVSDGSSKAKAASDINVTTPVVFDYKGKDLIVSAGKDGRLYLLDSQSVGGADHKTPLAQTPRLAAGTGSSNHGVWGGLSSWEDAAGTRWVAAPVWGSLNPELKVPVTNGATPNGAIVAFKVEEQNGKPALVPAWASRDMSSPVPPVITSGVVFALSAGEYTRRGAALRPKSSSHATLYAFDATTGKEMYSTGDQVTAPASLTGVTLANGRIFFTTSDSTLYGFGVFMEI